MRIAIREQLAALVVTAVLIALAIVSIPTWIYVNKFVVDVESNGLTLTASLKAARIASEIELIQSNCQTIASRLLIQQGFESYYNGNHTASNWGPASDDLKSALSTAGAALYQARLYARNSSGPSWGLVNITAPDVQPIELPDPLPDGSKAFLDNSTDGYPAALFPNITYVDLGYRSRADPSVNVWAANAFPDVRLYNNGGLILGPVIVNSSFALVSLTVPVMYNANQDFILGYMTLVASASFLLRIQQSAEGLGNTGTMLMIGPTTPYNRFNSSSPPSNNTYKPPNKETFGNADVRFILPPLAPADSSDRHSQHNFASGRYDDPWKVKQYPVVLDSFTSQIRGVNNASSRLDTTNEEGHQVSVGFARPQTGLVQWVVVVEQDKSEAYTPINTLRDILLGCVFGTAGLILLLVFPCAHFSVKPIRQLKYATEKSVAPPGYEGFDDELPSSGTRSQRSEKGWIVALRRKVDKYRRKYLADEDHDPNRRIFKIPGKVPEKKHFITDELTELTSTFNAMSDELYKQYESLDEKVAERTRELEISKKAAEAANESKTLFIANISHELKTPLNGIMGMCAVCMEEDDIVRIKQSLKTLYKSGDLLLHLLEDLLSFSKNQIGHQVSLEEKEFRLGDIRSQVLSIFDKQVREGKINFSVDFVGSDVLEQSPSPERVSMDRKLPALGPAGMGRLKDMCLWGDQHRILQVIINLVSNSLKFTPPGGKVGLRIRCLGEVEEPRDESRTSSFSKTGSNRPGRSRHRMGSSSTHSQSSKTGSTPATPFKGGTALSINPMDPKTTAHVHTRERSLSPPPPNAKSFLFEFDVEDTGPGIAEHMQERVFEPFVQGDLGLSKKFGGTGLGLSICQQLAGLMGGHITLRSTVGVGTTFIMQIPLKYVKDRASSTASSSMKSRPPSVGSVDDANLRPAMAKPVTDAKTSNLLNKQPRLVGLSQPFFAANPTPSPSKEEQLAAIDRAMANKAGQGKLRVLVADDNSTNIEVVSKMLKLEDIYDVTIAKDGQEAYDLVKANMEQNLHFDVIFMDIQMPNLDGLQSTRLIRKMGYSAPIVALTAFSEESNVKECMESGMDEFLSKPIRRPALKQVLKKFATIPEEPETASVLTRKTTPDNKSPTTAARPPTAAPNVPPPASTGAAPTVVGSGGGDGAVVANGPTSTIVGKTDLPKVSTVEDMTVNGPQPPHTNGAPLPPSSPPSPKTVPRA